MSVTRAVLDAADAGTSTVADIAARTGLDRDVVALALERLVATGRLTAQPLQAGCPPAGCGGCASSAGSAGGSPGCARPAGDTGPVLLSLGVRRS
jgi:hypothetical protein